MINNIISYTISYEEDYSAFLINVELSKLVIRQISGNVSSEFIEKMDLSLDESFMLSNYKIGLSAYEIISFVANKHVYKDFINSPFERCMIEDKSIELRYDNSIQLIDLAEIESDWDVYFPYNRIHHNNKENDYEFYKLGHVWGLDIYFLSKKGAKALDTLKVIRQPLDEEMLELSMNNILNVYYSEKNDYIYKENLLRKQSRNEAIKLAILNTNNWEANDKAQIGVLLNELSKIADLVNIKLTLGYGSLLGFVRHGGVMPWDDDVDLLVLDKDIQKLLSTLEKIKTISYSKAAWRHVTYYKIWSVKGKKIPNFDHTFPFIDIWVIKSDIDSINTAEGVLIPLNCFFPLCQTVFEGASFYIPADPQKCLDAFYQNWRTDMTIDPWCHQLEFAANFSLSAKIIVDAEGKLI